MATFFFQDTLQHQLVFQLILFFFFRKHFKWIYILVIWSVLFMFSRLYLAAHFPSDIITGATIGFCIGVLFVKLAKLVMKKFAI